MKWIKTYYYSLREAIDEVSEATNVPYSVITIKNLTIALNISLTNYDIDLDNTNVKALWNECFARFYKHFIIKENREVEDETTPTLSETKMKEWVFKYMSVLTRTYPYYNTLLTSYASAQNDLMGDIKATTKSLNYFNDTPQNPNTSGVYEGDNYISNFTKNVGETSSQLNSKMLRLKEIQDNYRRILHEWTKEFERIIMEGEEDE